MTWDRIDIGSAIFINIHPPSLKRHKRYKMPFLEDNMSSWGKSVSVLLLLVYVLELSLPRLVSKCTYPAHTYVRTPDHINRIPHFPPNAYVASSLSSSQHSQVSICHIQHVVLGLLRMWKSRKSVMNILFARLWESASAAGARTPTYETQSIVVDMFQCMFSRQPAVCRRGWIPSCFEENLNVYMFFNFSTLPSVVCVCVRKREKEARVSKLVYTRLDNLLSYTPTGTSYLPPILKAKETLLFPLPSCLPSFLWSILPSWLDN